MAPRAFWKGYLKLSLVTCRVQMEPARSDAAKVRFRTLNAKTGNPVVSQNVDDVSGKPVAEEDEIKGYPRGETDYVLLEDDEIDGVALESTRTIDIDMFVPSGSIASTWYDTPHYLSPADAVGEEAFTVIRQAMLSSKAVGIARLVLYRRERAVLLQPRGKGIVLWTLRYGDELRSTDAYFEGLKSQKPDRDLLALATRLIDERTTVWDPEMASDPVQTRLLDIIAAKKRGRKRPSKAKTVTEDGPSNVVSIMDALKKSLAAEEGKPQKNK